MWEAIESNKRKSFFLIVLLALILLALGFVIGAAVDPDAAPFGLLSALGLWIILISVAFASGEQVLLSSAGAREVTREQAPQLINIVEEMKIASGLPAMPRVFIIDADAPNAFAVGLKPERAAVAVTTGLLARLNRNELQGVIAHEIGHIANRDTMFMTLAGVTVGAVIILADVFLRGMRFGGLRRRSSRGGGQGAAIIALAAVILAILAPLMAQLLYFACSRRREYLADASAAQFTRYPEGLASALEKISGYRGGVLDVSRAVAPMFTVNPLQLAGGAASWFSTHPPTPDRVRVLRSMAGASLAAYEEAYRKLHGEGLVGARSVSEAPAMAARAPQEEPPSDPVTQWRAAKDVFHQAAGYAVIVCPCGLRIKRPPGFDKLSIKCPRCGRIHSTASAESLALAAAGQTVRMTRSPITPSPK
jgi:heat shock protein HtpX